MTHGPERIWMTLDRKGKIAKDQDAHVQPTPAVSSAYVEYVRADLVAAEVERLQTALNTAIKGEQESEANLAHALHQLATARDDALEEAAAWLSANALTDDEKALGVSFGDGIMEYVASEIRAMKGKPHD